VDLLTLFGWADAGGMSVVVEEPEVPSEPSDGVSENSGGP